MILRYHKYVNHNYESYLHNLEKNGSTSNESKSYNSTSKSYDSNEQKSKRLNSGILEPLKEIGFGLWTVYQRQSVSQF